VEAGVDRLPEQARLGVLVVDVVLALHGVAGEGEHARDRVAQDHAAAVADVQGPGRVHARELDLHLLAASQLARSVTGAERGDRAHDLAQPAVAEPEVDVAARGLGGHLRDVDARGQLLRDLGRGLPQDARQLESGAARVIAVLPVAGALELEVGHLVVSHAERLHGGLQGCAHAVAHVARELRHAGTRRTPDARPAA